MKAKDLEPIIGSKGHVSSILSGKREITLKMAQKLKNYFSIPAEVFLHNAQLSTFSILQGISANVPRLTRTCGLWKAIFPLKQNENTKINVPETEKLASALIGCWRQFFIVLL